MWQREFFLILWKEFFYVIYKMIAWKYVNKAFGISAALIIFRKCVYQDCSSTFARLHIYFPLLRQVASVLVIKGRSGWVRRFSGKSFISPVWIDPELRTWVIFGYIWLNSLQMRENVDFFSQVTMDRRTKTIERCSSGPFIRSAAGMWPRRGGEGVEEVVIRKVFGYTSVMRHRIARTNFFEVLGGSSIG